MRARWVNIGLSVPNCTFWLGRIAPRLDDWSAWRVPRSRRWRQGQGGNDLSSLFVHMHVSVLTQNGSQR